MSDTRHDDGLTISSFAPLLRYSDWANGQLVQACRGLNAEQLDRSFDMGVGSLRKTLLHIYNGEHVWLNRWQGRSETAWPGEEEPAEVAALGQRFESTWRERAAFLSSLTAAGLRRDVTYRDSRGSLFRAALADMILQMIVHSTHHRAQAVNMIRRVGGAAPEIDYMMWLRRPA